MVSLSSPFADFINVTVPEARYASVLSSLLEILRCMGLRDESVTGGFIGDRGFFKHGLRYKVGFFSASGDVLATLRACPVGDAFGDYLTVLAEGEHRVTKLDVALDVVDDGAQVVRRVYSRARRGQIVFTRKAVPREQVRKWSGVSLYGGRDTGTVELGSRTRDVWARVYDKRQELLQRVYKQHGTLSPELLALNDPGPLTRYELVLGRHVGVTARDAYQPTAVFWHFARESLLAPPDDAPQWSPHGEGFCVPRSLEPDYARQLSLLVESSHDIRRAVVLADRLGPHGRKHLHTLLNKVPAVGEVATAVV